MKVNASTSPLILIFVMIVLAASSACASGAISAVTPTSEPTAPLAATPTSASTPIPAASPTPEIVSTGLVACRAYLCEVPGFWELDPAGPKPLSLPFNPGAVYDASEATGRLLYSSVATDDGAGPGNVAVGNLGWLDIRSGQIRPVRADAAIVEAVWAPDGQSFAYVLATPETYELHWFTATGEDQLLAKDVAFTFSVSPSGDQVAFTRETGYNLNVTPGLYVVDVATGQERPVSTVDRAGSGSISDQPVWSPDGRHILLPATVEGNSSYVMVSTDGSGSTPLKVAPEVSAAVKNDLLSFSLWYPDGLHLVGSSFSGMGGGPNRLVVFGLNETMDTVVSVVVLREDNSVAVAWDEPGVSVWARTPDGLLESVPLE